MLANGGPLTTGVVFGGFAVMPDGTQYAAVGRDDTNRLVECDPFGRLARANAITSDPGAYWLPLFMERNATYVYVLGEGLGNLWVNDRQLTVAGSQPSLSVDGPAVLYTVGALDGIADLEGQHESIVAGHFGVAIHYRGAGKYGWLSTDDTGMLFYSIGPRGGPWATEATGTSLSGRRLYPHVATHPVTGEPHLAFVLPQFAAAGEPPEPARVVSIAKGSYGWQTWETVVEQSDPQHTRASWVGCGKPAAEFTVSTGDGARGWYVLEARRVSSH